MKPVHLYRIGSDPEFVFAKITEWQHYVVPADGVISKNKAAALQSFIGVDGHAATAELRPTPAHNIHRHMLDLATAIQAIDEYLKKREGIIPIALPWVGNEPLGGHVHVSFFADEPLMKYAWEHNYVGAFGKLNAVDQNLPPGDVETSKMEQMMSMTTKLPLPDQVLIALNWLVMPFECWVQPWPNRRKRNAKYGELATTQIRWMNSSRPNMPNYKDSAYLHYEYRSPSTWLMHPWVAYIYLALVKLTMLNLPLFHEKAVEDMKAKRGTTFFSAVPSNDNNKELFHTRWNSVESKLRITNDIKDLTKAVNYCEKFRMQWFDPYRGIDTHAWRDLL